MNKLIGKKNYKNNLMKFTKEEVKNMTLQELIDLPSEEKENIIRTFGNLILILNNGKELFQLNRLFVAIGSDKSEEKFSWIQRPMSIKYGIDINYGMDLFMEN
jgi:hypothetical protein